MVRKNLWKKYIVILLQVIETSVESQESRRKTSGSSSSRPYKMKRFSVFPIRVSLISNGANYRHEPSHVPGEPRLDCITKHLRLKPGVFFLCLNNKRAGLFIGWTHQAGKEKEHLHTSGRPAWFWFVAETRMGASRRRGGCVCVWAGVCVCVHAGRMLCSRKGSGREGEEWAAPLSLRQEPSQERTGATFCWRIRVTPCADIIPVALKCADLLIPKVRLFNPTSPLPLRLFLLCIRL